MSNRFSGEAVWSCGGGSGAFCGGLRETRERYGIGGGIRVEEELLFEGRTKKQERDIWDDGWDVNGQKKADGVEREDRCSVRDEKETNNFV